MGISEKLIVQQLKAGNESAYKYLYDRHYQVLCHIANYYVKDAFIAETIVGDTIVHLWEIRNDLNITIDIRRYLVKSVKNRSLDYLKSSYAQNRMLIPIEELGYSNTIVHPNIIENNALGLLLEKELENEVMLAIEHLPEECKQVFRMSRFANKKYDEITMELGISINTVKYHIKHALFLLRKELAKYLLLTLFFLT